MRQLGLNGDSLFSPHFNIYLRCRCNIRGRRSFLSPAVLRRRIGLSTGKLCCDVTHCGTETDDPRASLVSLPAQRPAGARGASQVAYIMGCPSFGWRVAPALPRDSQVFASHNGTDGQALESEARRHYRVLSERSTFSWTPGQSCARSRLRPCS